MSTDRKSGFGQILRVLKLALLRRHVATDHASLGELVTQARVLAQHLLELLGRGRGRVPSDAGRRLGQAGGVGIEALLLAGPADLAGLRASCGLVADDALLEIFLALRISLRLDAVGLLEALDVARFLALFIGQPSLVFDVAHHHAADRVAGIADRVAHRAPNEPAHIKPPLLRG